MLRPVFRALLILAGLLGAAPQAAAAAVPQSLTVYCQATTPGTQYGAQFTALNDQFTAANAYTLTFSDSGAALSTTTGTVIASSALPPSLAWTPPLGVFLYPDPSAGAFSALEGLPLAQIAITGGSSLGIGPYGITGCTLQSSGDPQDSARFSVMPTAAILAATPVLSGPTTPNGALINAAVGAPLSYQITASNAPTAYSCTSLDLQPTPLPTGLSLSPTTGLITGTPGAGTAGSYVVDLQAANAVGVGSAEATLNIAPNGASPVIASALSATATAGSPFTYAITASNTPTTYAATPLPTGVTFNASSGTLGGSPAYPGVYQVAISAGNAAGTGQSQVAITVAAAAGAPAITSAISTSGTVGAPFSFQLTTSASATAYGLESYTLPLATTQGSLPAALSFDASAGVISGTPTQSGITQIGVFASNAAGTGGISFLDIVIASGAGAPLITSAATATGTVGSAFSYSIIASGATAYGLSGAPANLSVATSTGVISGQPSAAGTSAATISATNASGTAAQTLTITVNAAAATTPPAITSGLTVSSLAGAAFTYQITASQSPTSYAARFVPIGLTLNPTTGALSGTLAIAGTSYVTIAATNAGGSGTALLVINAIGGGAGTTSASATSGTATAATGTGTTTGGQATYGGEGGGCGLGGSGAALILATLLVLRLGVPRRGLTRG